MKALIKTAREPGLSYVTDQKMPVPKEDEVLVKVKAAAICGTDVNFWKWNAGGASFADQYQVQFPFVLGHECCGDIVQVGSQVKDLSIGDRVAFETHIYCGHCYQCRNGNAHLCENMKIYGTSCDGCFSEYATAPASVAFKLPEKVSYEQGALFEPAGVAMHGIQKANIQPGDTVLVFGCGPIGLLAILLLKSLNAGEVIGVDIDDYRLGLAESFGAVTINSAKEDLLNTVRKLTDVRGGVDVVIEASGAPMVFDSIFDLIRPAGRLVTIAHPAKPVTFNVSKVINTQGVSITGVFGRRIWDTWYNVLSLVISGKVDLTRVVTHRYPLSAGNDAFEQLAKGAGKILYLPEME